MKNKQTAIDWFLDKIKSHFEHDGDLYESVLFTYAIAKEKEKEMIIDFTDDYVDNCIIPNENNAIPTIIDVPQYYNETYGGKL